MSFVLLEGFRDKLLFNLFKSFFQRIIHVENCIQNVVNTSSKLAKPLIEKVFSERIVLLRNRENKLVGVQGKLRTFEILQYFQNKLIFFLDESMIQETITVYLQ